MKACSFFSAGSCLQRSKVCSIPPVSTLFFSLELVLYPGPEGWELPPKLKSLLDSARFHFGSSLEEGFVSKAGGVGVSSKAHEDGLLSKNLWALKRRGKEGNWKGQFYCLERAAYPSLYHLSPTSEGEGNLW